MLERETELIKQIIVESTINGRDAVKLNEVVAANVPRGVKAFLTSRVVRVLEGDVQGSPKLARITQSIARTVPAERALLRSLAMEYVLQRDEYLQLVEDTVHFLENYLCRPQWTLAQLMFEKNETIRFEDMVRVFDSTAEYSYFALLVERHAQRNQLTEISKTDFVQLINRIDEEIIKRHTPRELALIARPIFDFLLFGDQSMSRPIPLGALLLFYEDKKLNAIKTYLERICQVRSRTQLSMNELIEIIEDLYNVESTVQKDVQESEQEILGTKPKPVEEPQAPEEQEATEPSPVQEEAGQPTEPVQKETAPATPATPQNSSAPDEEPTPPAEVVPTEAPAVEITQLDSQILADDVPAPEPTHASIAHPDILLAYASERDARRHATVITRKEETAEPQANPLPDVDTLLSEEQRKRFISQVFKNDEGYYGIFVASINKAPTWRDAQKHLRELFELNKLDILSSDVIEFTDAMHSRYEPDLKSGQ